MKTPYPFQVEAVHKALKTNGFLVADDCGLGKTITAIEIAKASRAKYWSTGPWRCLVVVPPSLILQWVDAIQDQDPGWRVHVPGRIPYNYLATTGYMVMSYYDLHHDGTFKGLCGLIWDAMIIDEAHRIKNRKSKTSYFVKQINAARKVALTGTPMEKNPADLWSILNFFDPETFSTYWGWVMRNLEVKEGYFAKYEVGGPKDVVAFGKMLKPYMIRRTKEEVAPELPEKIVIDQHVALSPDQEELYFDIRKQTDIEVHAQGKVMRIPNALAMLVRLQQVSSYPPLLDLKAKSGKLLWVDEFLEDHPGEPTVIFTKFRGTAEHLAEKYGASLIIGGDRRYEKGAKILVGTIDAMGEGLNLQWAKHAIFVDAHWSTIKMTQAMDRIHRIDIKEPKNIYLLWSCREDKLVLDAIDKKWTEAELVYYFLNPPV